MYLFWVNYTVVPCGLTLFQFGTLWFETWHFGTLWRYFVILIITNLQKLPVDPNFFQKSTNRSLDTYYLGTKMRTLKFWIHIQIGPSKITNWPCGLNFVFIFLHYKKYYLYIYWKKNQIVKFWGLNYIFFSHYCFLNMFINFYITKNIIHIYTARGTKIYIFWVLIIYFISWIKM